MLNHKFNAFKKQKSKSKIFITILCIFGLLFSYSCSCKNNVTGPGNDGLEDGKVTKITPTGDSNTFTPYLSQSKSQTNLIASDNGTSKTTVKIEFADKNNYNIKNVVMKTVTGEGQDLSANSEYRFSDGSYELSIPKDDLKKVLDNMNSTTAPATNSLDLTFEITTDSTVVTNKTVTLSVKVVLVKAQRIDTTKAQSIMNAATKLDSFVGAQNGTAFTYDESKGSSVNGNTTTIKNVKHDGSESGSPSIYTAAVEIRNQGEMVGEYGTYFDDFDIIDTKNGVGTKKAKIEIKFKPKNIYDFTEKDLTYYIELVLTDGSKYNWIA